jgi:hypothetical protein
MQITARILRNWAKEMMLGADLVAGAGVEVGDSVVTKPNTIRPSLPLLRQTYAKVPPWLDPGCVTWALL